MPIYFAHCSKNVYGLVHAGWRGLVYGILESTSQLILENGYKLHDFEILLALQYKNVVSKLGMILLEILK